MTRCTFSFALPQVVELEGALAAERERAAALECALGKARAHVAELALAKEAAATLAAEQHNKVRRAHVLTCGGISKR